MTSKSYKGRGVSNNPANRFSETYVEEAIEAVLQNDNTSQIKTAITIDNSQTIISRNQSPDVPFTQTINPYRGCEHGCVYCYARPTHAYLDLSPGLDFESKLIIKPKAAELLRKVLSKKGYICEPIGLGSNTDPYQPIERQYQITRQILEVLCEFRHPVGIITKSSMIERDTDILVDLARDKLVEVMISVTTLDKELARKMEPRASSPTRRLQTLAHLSAEGIPAGVLVAPVIPMLNDAEMEAILKQCADAGASVAGYILLRLPREVAGMFQDWLQAHYPLKFQHIMNLIREAHGGKNYNPEFGTRMRGSSAYASMIQHRFENARQRFGYSTDRFRLNVHNFSAPRGSKMQLQLF